MMIITPMDFVVFILQRFFSKWKGRRLIRVMFLEYMQRGKALWCLPFDIAETKSSNGTTVRGTKCTP